MTEEDYSLAWEYASDDRWGAPIQEQVKEFVQHIHDHRAAKFWECITGRLPHLYPYDAPAPQLNPGSTFRVAAALRQEGHRGLYVIPERPHWGIDNFHAKLSLDNGDTLDIVLRGPQDYSEEDTADGTWRNYVAKRVKLVRWWASGDAFRRIVETPGGVDVLYEATCAAIAETAPSVRDSPEVLEDVREFFSGFLRREASALEAAAADAPDR